MTICEYTNYPGQLSLAIPQWVGATPSIGNGCTATTGKKMANSA